MEPIRIKNIKIRDREIFVNLMLREINNVKIKVFKKNDIDVIANKNGKLPMAVTKEFVAFNIIFIKFIMSLLKFLFKVTIIITVF